MQMKSSDEINASIRARALHRGISIFNMSESTLSSRGSRALKPALSYFHKQFSAFSDLFSADNPNGYVLMAVAENRLSFGMLKEKLCDSTCRVLSNSTGSYDNMRGRTAFRDAYAALMESEVTQGARVHPEQLVITAGAGQLISSLAHLLLDEGDSILLFTPTYGALYNDFTVLSNCKIVDVPYSGRNFRMTERSLDDALKRAASPVKMLFLIQPNNPLGIVHSREEIEMAIRWCRVHKIHCVVDEIYANSVYLNEEHIPDAEQFVSAVTICRDELDIQEMAAQTAFCMNNVDWLPSSSNSSTSSSAAASTELQDSKQSEEKQVSVEDANQLPTFLGDYVHVIWGFSKDWAASGLRVGVLYSHNAALLSAYENINYFAAVAHDTQDTLAAICRDQQWVRSYFDANRAALRKSFEALAPILREAHIPFVQPTAGMFVWLDLRAFLPDLKSSDSSSTPHPFERERLLTDRLYDEAKLLFTPGEACHAAEPGFFRCCFAWAPAEGIAEGFRRLAKWAATQRASKQSTQ